MAHQVIKVRCSELLVRRMDALAAGYNGNRSAAVRSAVLAASLPEGTPDVPDRDELLRLLGELARMGSLPAIRLLLRELPAEAKSGPDWLERFCERRRQRLEGHGLNGAGRESGTAGVSDAG